MGDKYYIEIPEGEWESTCDVIKWDKPFDSLEESKSYADTLDVYGSITIYRCSDNILTPILNNNFGWNPMPYRFERPTAE